MGAPVRHDSQLDKFLDFNLRAMLVVMILVFWGGLLYCAYKTLEYLL